MENQAIRVGIVMGSDSDFAVMRETAVLLDEFAVPYEMIVASAHRTPEKALTFAAEAKTRGIQVIIAGAGAAAHLPGVIAAKTTLPVIGVPINATSLQGLDALYAIVQMPSGIPVATVAINGAKNAGLLAVQMMALADERLAQQLETYKADMASAVEKKNQRLQEKIVAMREEQA